MSKMASGNYDDGKSNDKNRNSNRDDQGPRTYHKWRYKNPDNAATREVRGTTMKWCTNDCHDKAMWCGRRTCTNRADYAAAMQKKRDKGASNSTTSTTARKSSYSKDFKIAVAALTSAEDFASLEEQFFDSKE